VRLDTAQLALLTRRLAGDLTLFAQQHGAQSAGAPAATFTKVATPSAPLEERRLTADELQNQSAMPSAAPCTLTPAEGTIKDGYALGTSVAFSKLMEYLADHGMGVAGKIASVTGTANLALAYAKLTATMAAFNGDIQMQGDPPLVRTRQHSPPGELRQFTATVKLDLDKSQIAICLRPMLNSIVLDFSLPNGGAIAGAEVH
jgi:hypothetical protein